MSTVASNILSFNSHLSFKGKLPKGINVLNPFSSPEIISITKAFYNKFYNDTKSRYMILGINPGRHGAGVTGIPFTDTKRLAEFCGLNITHFKSHETSSVFVYDVINAYGGVKKFYNKFYISSICPLGFTALSPSGREINHNYYDSRELYKSAYGFIADSLKKHISMGFKSDVVFCMGNNANFRCLTEINNNEKLFGRIIPLEHPRFIMQYRLKKKDFYIKKYLNALQEV